MDAVIHSSVDWLPTAARGRCAEVRYSTLSTARLSKAVWFQPEPMPIIPWACI
jgi:hypothetical protein